MARLFAGLDVSTQSTKLVVIDYDEQDVVHVDLLSYDTDLPEFGTKEGVVPGLGEGVSESEPRMWLAAVDLIFERLSRARSGVPVREIRSISVSGQQHGLVALDGGGNLTRSRAKLWNDYSTYEECTLLTDAVGGLESMIAAVGNSQRPGYTAPKILHMARYEPKAFGKTATFFLVHNYVNWYLSGGVRSMEPGDTSGMALWNPKTRAWAPSVLQAIDPKLVQKLPEVNPSDASIGRVSSSLVERFGFSPECTVDAGSGDNMYGAIGTGNVKPGVVTVSLGTSGTAYTFLPEPFVDPKGEIAAFCDSTGHYLPLVCVSNLANGYNEVLKRFELTHETFGEVVRQTPPGNDGRVLIPWYVGERTPDVPIAAPVYFGFALDGFGREELCRAVLEGHVLNLHAGFERLPVEVEELRLTGGLSRSDAWCQTIADIFDADTVPVAGEGAALGAALHAAWVWMKENGDGISIEGVCEPFVTLDNAGRKRPQPSTLEVYRSQKRVFAALSRRVRGLPSADPFRLRAHGWTG